MKSGSLKEKPKGSGSPYHLSGTQKKKSVASQKELVVPLATEDLQGTKAANQESYTQKIKQRKEAETLNRSAGGGVAADTATVMALKGRSTDDVLQDILHTYVGIVSVSKFEEMQNATLQLMESIRKGSAFAHDAVHPTVPEVLEDWFDGKKELCGSGEETAELVPAMDVLPPCKRCDVAAVREIRTFFNAFFKKLANLLQWMERLEGKWGKLTEAQRTSLNEAVEGVHRNLVSKEKCYQCFKELDFTGENISSTGELLEHCSHTEIIRLSDNPELKEVDYLPPRCHTMLACACDISNINTTSSELLVQGLSYNALPNLDFMMGFPSLTVLDFSFNRLCDLDSTTEAIANHPSLLNLSLMGNPIAFLDVYRRNIAFACPRLERLDGKIIMTEERQPLLYSRLAAQAIANSKAVNSPHSKSNKNRRKSEKDIFGNTLTADEVAVWESNFNQTLAVSMQLLSVTELDKLMSADVTSITSFAELKPHAALWYQVLGPLAASLPEVASTAAAQGASGKKQQGHSALLVPLYDCQSTVFLKGSWGSGCSADKDSSSGEGILVELKMPVSTSEVAGAGAVSKLRKAVATASVDPQTYIPVPPEGYYGEELYLSPDLVKRLREPFFIQVEVEDTYTLYSEAGLRAATEHPSSSAGGRKTKEGSGLHGEGSSTTETARHLVGELMFYPVDLFEVDRRELPEGDVLPEKRVLYAKAELHLREGDLRLEEARLNQQRQALLDAILAYDNTYVELLERQKELEGSGGRNQGESPTKSLNSTVNRRAASGARRQSSMRTMTRFLELQPLQERVAQLQTEVVDRGVRALVTARRLETFRAANLAVEAKFILGRGALPADDPSELAGTGKKKANKAKK